MKGFTDIADFDEDTRIDMIGKAAMSGKQSSGEKPLIIGFVVDNHIKADRYIKKLREKFPTIRIIDRFDGPVQNTVTVRVGPPLL
jgi:hypothetical protein